MSSIAYARILGSTNGNVFDVADVLLVTVATLVLLTDGEIHLIITECPGKKIGNSYHVFNTLESKNHSLRCVFPQHCKG